MVTDSPDDIVNRQFGSQCMRFTRKQIDLLDSVAQISMGYKLSIVKNLLINHPESAVIGKNLRTWTLRKQRQQEGPNFRIDSEMKPTTEKDRWMHAVKSFAYTQFPMTVITDHISQNLFLGLIFYQCSPPPLLRLECKTGLDFCAVQLTRGSASHCESVIHCMAGYSSLPEQRVFPDGRFVRRDLSSEPMVKGMILHETLQLMSTHVKRLFVWELGLQFAGVDLKEQKKFWEERQQHPNTKSISLNSIFEVIILRPHVWQVLSAFQPNVPNDGICPSYWTLDSALLCLRKKFPNDATINNFIAVKARIGEQTDAYVEAQKLVFLFDKLRVDLSD